jgi:quercetin dioxygenase-like cupin family protein
MRRACHRSLAVGLAAASTLIVSAMAAAAPPDRQPITLSCATNAFVQPLSGGTPMGVEGKSLVLIRVIFEPGGGIGPHTHPGTLAQTVESGRFGFTLLQEGEMSLMRSGDAGTPAVEESIPVGQEVELGPGDSFVETGMVHTGRAIGDEPVVLLYAGLFDAGEPLTSCVEGTPTP